MVVDLVVNSGTMFFVDGVRVFGFDKSLCEDTSSDQVRVCHQLLGNAAILAAGNGNLSLMSA